MKRRIRCALLALIVPLTAMGADITVPRLSGALTLDGRLDEPMWRAAARLPHTEFLRWIADTYTDTGVFHLRFFHDGRVLYVALVSYDSHVEADAAPEDADGLYSLSIATPSDELKHYRLRWSANPPIAAGEMLKLRKWSARLRGPFQDPARPGGGYVFEIAIPLWSIGWKPGDTIPVNIIVNDHNGKPNAPFRTPGTEFARFAWGSFENDNLAGYRTIQLAP